MSREGNWLSETHEGICYLSFTVIILLFGIVCFAIGSTYRVFVPIGITLTLLAALFFILFLWRRKRRQDSDCCTCCTSDAAISRCDRCCFATLLCLSTPTAEEREEEAQARLRRIITPVDPSVVGTSSRAARWPELQSLQKVIQNLQREYQYLERYPDMIAQLEECYMSLHRQETTLAEWAAGRDTPTREDIKAMKSRLSRIKQELRRALTVAETNNLRQLSGELPSISQRLDLTSIAGPQPPPYAAEDPLDSTTSSLYTEMTMQELPSVLTTNRNSVYSHIQGYNHNVPLSRDHNAPTEGAGRQNRNSGYSAPIGTARRQNTPFRTSNHGPNAPISILGIHNAPNARHNVPDIRVSMQHNGPSVSINACYDNPCLDSTFDGLPPEDETDAPPSYEDAVSSTV